MDAAREAFQAKWREVHTPEAHQWRVVDQQCLESAITAYLSATGLMWRPVEELRPADGIVILTDGKTRWFSDLASTPDRAAIAEWCGWKDPTPTHFINPTPPASPDKGPAHD